MVSDKKFVFFLILVGILILLNLPPTVSNWMKGLIRDTVAPLQALVVGAGKPFRSSAPRALGGDNPQAVREIARLREEIRQLSTLEAENESLREVVGFKARSRYALVACEVVGRGDSTGWWQTLTLNRGSDDGVSSNMAVVAIEGLIGRTLDVSRHTATVMLISDPQCKVSCRFTRTGAFGILRGGGVRLTGNPEIEFISGIRPSRMDYVPKDQRVFESDDVVTSGLGGIYPEGLPVGRVVQTELDTTGLYQRSEVEPIVDLARVRYAFVILKPGEAP